MHEMTKATKELNEIIRSASLEPAWVPLVWHQHHFVVIDDLPLAMTLYPQLQINSGSRTGA